MNIPVLIAHRKGVRANTSEKQYYHLYLAPSPGDHSNLRLSSSILMSFLCAHAHIDSSANHVPVTSIIIRSIS